MRANERTMIYHRLNLPATTYNVVRHAVERIVHANKKDLRHEITSAGLSNLYLNDDKFAFFSSFNKFNALNIIDYINQGIIE